MGDDESIDNFFKAADLLGTIKDIKIKKLEYKKCSILSRLTNDQKKILDSAKKHGYYDYPRKITSDELSDKIGLSKDITLQSLRKAEKRIISIILENN